MSSEIVRSTFVALSLIYRVESELFGCLPYLGTSRFHAKIKIERKKKKSSAEKQKYYRVESDLGILKAEKNARLSS